MKYVMNIDQVDKVGGTLALVATWIAMAVDIIKLPELFNSGVSAALISLISLLVTFFGNRFLRKFYDKKDGKKAR